jgi:branched-chain amino acid transport system permease protein
MTDTVTTRPDPVPSTEPAVVRGVGLKHDLVRLGSAALFAVLMGVVAGDNAFWIRVVTSAAILYILVGAYNIIFGYAGLFSLAHVVLYSIGGYGSVILEDRAGMSFWVAVPVAMAISTIVALLLAYPTARLGGAFFALGTLALAVGAQELTTGWTGLTGGAQGYLGIAPPEVFGRTLIGGTVDYYWLVAPLAVICFELFHRTSASAVSRRMVALRESAVATEAVGIDPRRVRVTAFGLSGLFAGLAGALFAHQQLFISPESFGLHIMIQTLIVLLIGGAGTRLGPAIGVIALVAIQEGGEQLGNASNLLFGVSIIVIIAFAPGGLVGIGAQLTRRVGRSRRTAYAPTVRVQLPHPDVEASSPRTLSVTDVELAFAGVKAVDGVNLTVHSGEVLGLIGPNGAGKTSVVNVISALSRPSAGDVRLDGESLVGLQPYQVARRGVVRTFQSARLIPTFDLVTNVMLGRAAYSRSSLLGELIHSPRSRQDDNDAYGFALGLLELMGVHDHAFTQAADLPYGVLRRAEIARAMALEPAFLLLDEPGAGLGVGERDEIAAAIRAVEARGVGVILIDHNVQFVASVCNRLIVLSSGRILADGETREVLERRDVVTAYLGGAAR